MKQRQKLENKMQKYLIIILLIFLILGCRKFTIESNNKNIFVKIDINNVIIKNRRIIVNGDILINNKSDSTLCIDLTKTKLIFGEQKSIKADNGFIDDISIYRPIKIKSNKCLSKNLNWYFNYDDSIDFSYIFNRKRNAEIILYFVNE